MTGKVRSQEEFDQKFGWDPEDVTVTDADGNPVDVRTDERKAEDAAKAKKKAPEG